MSIRDAIVAAARSYLGCRYQHQGRVRTGIDCAGLIIAVAHDVGLPAEDMAGYARIPDGKALRRHLDSQAAPVAYADRQPGDILLLAFDRGLPQHLAITTDYGMIHAYAGARKVVEHRIDEMWAARILGAYRYPGVDE